MKLPATRYPLPAHRGFTLIELLVVIGIIAILATIVIVAVSPVRQFRQARNTQRSANVNAVLNAIGQNMADNNGVFNCAAGPLPATPTNMTSSGGYNIAPCLVPIYLAAMPFDPAPSPTPNFYNSVTDYNTGYSVEQTGGITGRVTVNAPATEEIPVISVTR